MKKYNFLSKILIVSIFITTASLFCPEGKPAGAEVSEEWKKAEPTTKESIDELRDKSREELDKATKESEEAQTEEEKDKAKIEIDKANYNLKTADIAQSKLEYQEDPTLKEYKEKIIKKAQDFQKQLEQDIQQLTEKLAQTYEPPVQEQKPFSIEQTVGDLTKIVEKGPTLKDAAQAQEISNIQNSFDTNFNIDAMKDVIKKEKNTDKKRGLIDTFRGQIDEVYKKIDKELGKIKDDKSVSDEYTKALERFKDSITEKNAALDAQSIEVDAKNIGFFERLANQLTNWFDRTFDFHKSAAEKGSIDTELSMIKQNEQQIKPFVRLFDDVNKLTQDVQEQIGTIQLSLQNKDYTNISRQIRNAKKILQTIDSIKEDVQDFQTIERSAKNLIEEASNDLEKLTNDLFAKQERYKGTNPTLYAKQLNSYKVASTPTTGESFGPNRLYEALGFDPQLDPAKITQEQIEKMYASKNLLEGGREREAARKAYPILSNPAARATYDAFLKDYNALEKKGIDPSRPTTKTVQEWLNSQGELAKLEINEAQYNKINKGIETLTNTQKKVGETQSQVKSVKSYLDQLNSVQEKLKGILTPDYNYKTLEVENTATPAEITKAYRKLALQWHQDKWSGKSKEKQEKATEKFKEISNAYDILKDPQLRKEYDKLQSILKGKSSPQVPG